MPKKVRMLMSMASMFALVVVLMPYSYIDAAVRYDLKPYAWLIIINYCMCL